MPTPLQKASGVQEPISASRTREQGWPANNTSRFTNAHVFPKNKKTATRASHSRPSNLGVHSASL